MGNSELLLYLSFRPFFPIFSHRSFYTAFITVSGSRKSLLVNLLQMGRELMAQQAEKDRNPVLDAIKGGQGDVELHISF